MKRSVPFLALVSLLSIGLAAPASYAGEMPGFTHEFYEGRIFIADPAEKAADEVATFDGMDLIGAAVNNPQGELLGLVSGLQIDSGGRAFAIINHGSDEIYGPGGRFTLVPVEALNISESSADFELVAVLDMNQEQLAAAPFYNPARTDERGYLAGIYRHYGLQPYWTDEAQPTEDQITEEPRVTEDQVDYYLYYYP